MTGRGRFIAVVGPSGVGKDTLIDALAKRRPDLHRVRRLITRDATAGGEPFVAVTEAEFDHALAAGRLALSWRAHGLRYGIPASAAAILAAGGDAIANLSRGQIGAERARLAPVLVLSLTARADTLAHRLRGRGRETDADIGARLRRAGTPVPTGPDVVQIANDGPLADSVAQALAVLYPLSGTR